VKTGTRYRNSALAERYLAGDDGLTGLVRYCHQRSYPAWTSLANALRDDKPATWDPETQDTLHGSADDRMMRLYWGATHSLSVTTAHALGTAYDFTPHQRLLDIGSGTGAYPIELHRMYPHLTATIFDLPHVCELARHRIHAEGVSEAVHTHGGDFHTDPPCHQATTSCCSPGSCTTGTSSATAPCWPNAIKHYHPTILGSRRQRRTHRRQMSDGVREAVEDLGDTGHA